MPNKYKWHIIVIPEDDATRHIGNGLINAFPQIENCIKVLPVTRGWTRAVKCVETLDLQQNKFRRVLLIIDFDKNKERLDIIREKKEFSEFKDRIFIIGCFNEAEDLKKLVGKSNLEQVGKELGENCDYWSDHCLLDCRDDACRLKCEIPY